MVFFVSDTHFGQGARQEERAVEDALLTCLASYEEQATHLYLVGDIFDGYIEYRRVVPKGFVRFLSLLAAWTDRGVGVTYLVGNHDPWHRDYFATELGVRVMPGHVLEHVADALCYVQHGDDLGRSGRGLCGIRPLLRDPAMVWLYRSLLPADAGVALAHCVSRWLQRRRPSPHAAADMRRFAQETLRSTASQVLVMGHSHQAELCAWPEGVYMNLGSWRDGGSFGLLEAGRIQLLRWRGGKAELVKEHAWQ